MRSTLFLAAAVAAIPAAASAQNCVYFPDDKAHQGPSSLKPFGNVSTTDPKWSAQTIMIFLPKEKLGTQAREIRSIAFAPVSSRTRVFTRMYVTLKQTDQTASQLDKTFYKNGSGFSSTLQLHKAAWPVSSNTWNRLPVRYPYKPGRNLLVTIAIQGAGSTGSGDAGFRQDPSLDVVYAPNWLPRDGTVGKGGPKLEICFDGGFLQRFDDGACQGSNGKMPHLDLSGSSKLGRSFTVGLSDAPGPAGVAVFLMSYLGNFSAGIDLKDAGASGCFLRVYPHLVLPGATIGGKAAVTLPIPNDVVFLRLASPLGFQWFVWDPTVNNLKLTSSNWGLVQPGN